MSSRDENANLPEGCGFDESGAYAEVRILRTSHAYLAIVAWLLLFAVTMPVGFWIEDTSGLMFLYATGFVLPMAAFGLSIANTQKLRVDGLHLRVGSLQIPRDELAGLRAYSQGSGSKESKHLEVRWNGEVWHWRLFGSGVIERANWLAEQASELPRRERGIPGDVPDALRDLSAPRQAGRAESSRT